MAAKYPHPPIDDYLAIVPEVARSCYPLLVTNGWRLSDCQVTSARDIERALRDIVYAFFRLSWITQLPHYSVERFAITQEGIVLEAMGYYHLFRIEKAEPEPQKSPESLPLLLGGLTRKKLKIKHE